jgi:hypothetical protein
MCLVSKRGVVFSNYWTELDMLIGGEFVETLLRVNFEMVIRTQIVHRQIKGFSFTNEMERMKSWGSIFLNHQ